MKHVCDICDAKFSTTHTKTRHINTNHSVEDNTVHRPKCPSMFTSKQYLKYHDNLEHTHRKPYTCEECNQGFASPYLLHIHKKSHGKR